MSLTAKQLAIRMTGTTATDARALVGLDPYGRTRHDVWLEKCGLSKARSEAEWLSLGTEIEPVVIRRLAARRHFETLAIKPDDMTIVHPKLKTHIATPDAFFISEDAPKRARKAKDAENIGQVKVVGPFHAEGWGKSESEEVPDWLRVQTQWEMHVTGHHEEHVGALIWPSLRFYTVASDPELEGLLVEECDRFWVDFVLAKKAPTVDGSEGSSRMLKQLFAIESGPIVKASGEAESLARQYFETKRARELAEQEHETAKQLLQLACGGFAGIDGDGWRLRYCTRKERHVTPEPYTVPSCRHWDIRAVKGKGRE